MVVHDLVPRDARTTHGVLLATRRTEPGRVDCGKGTDAPCKPGTSASAKDCLQACRKVRHATELELLHGCGGGRWGVEGVNNNTTLSKLLPDTTRPLASRSDCSQGMHLR